MQIVVSDSSGHYDQQPSAYITHKPDQLSLQPISLPTQPRKVLAALMNSRHYASAFLKHPSAFLLSALDVVPGAQDYEMKCSCKEELAVA